jgi:hypothetical protein
MNVPCSERALLRLIYIDIIKHTCIGSWSVKEMREKNVVFLRFYLLYLFNVMNLPNTAQARPWAHSQAKL